MPHRVSVQEMRKDHEEQLQRLKRLKDQEIDAVTSATSHTRYQWPASYPHVDPWLWCSLSYGEPASDHRRNRGHLVSHLLPPGMLTCLISISTPLSSSYIFLLLCYDPERFGQGCLPFWPTTHTPLHHGETKCVSQG